MYSLWLSPIFKNRKELNTYHGYGIQNLPTKLTRGMPLKTYRLS